MDKVQKHNSFNSLSWILWTISDIKSLLHRTQVWAA